MYRILLVDDEPVMKMAFHKIMDWNSTEFQVVGTTSDGQEALEFLKAEPVDIVITDLKMPHMDGIELIRRLKATGFDGCVLVLSNYSEFESVREALLAGAQDYMLKLDLDQATLLAQLQAASGQIAQSRMRRQVEQARALEHRRNALQAQAGALISYLTASEPQEPTPSLLPDEPYFLCDLLLWPNAMQLARGLPLAHIQDVLRSIFVEVNSPILVAMQRDELLCLIPCAALSERGHLIEDKAEQIVRQLKLYFDLKATVLLPPPVTGLTAAYEAYSRCRAARAVFFYPARPALVHPESLYFSELPPEWSAAGKVRQFTDLFNAGKMDELGAILDEFLSDCEAACVGPGETRGFVYRTMQKLLRSVDGDDDAVEAARTQLLSAESSAQLREQVIALMAMLRERVLPPASRHYKREVRDAMLFVKHHYFERITLDEVAQAVNLNRSYLCRVFKKQTGVGLFQYLNSFRMEKAGELIEGGNVYIKEVAREVGMEDPFYFTRLFKRHYGVAPTEYKKTPN